MRRSPIFQPCCVSRYARSFVRDAVELGVVADDLSHVGQLILARVERVHINSTSSWTSVYPFALTHLANPKKNFGSQLFFGSFAAIQRNLLVDAIDADTFTALTSRTQRAYVSHPASVKRLSPIHHSVRTK